jgi:hypothetical protein
LSGWAAVEDRSAEPVVDALGEQLGETPPKGPLISGPFSLDHPLSRVSAHISGQQLALNAIA